MSNQIQITRLLVIGLLAVGTVNMTIAADDPMRPPSEIPATTAKKITKKPLGSEFHLSSIRITQERRTAIINGKRVAIGQNIGKAKVTAINANNVVLHQSGKKFLISLLPLSIKKPVEATQP